MAIGYIGLGNMGGALAARLAASTPDVLVWDRDPAAVARLSSQDCRAATSITEIAACQTIFTCLPTSEHVDQVLFNDDGLFDNLRSNSTIIDQTSGDPRKSRDFAARLKTKSVAFVDAPVSGGPARATAGTIAIMVGGDELDYKTVHPLLSNISPNVFHAGAVGAGHLIKLVNNMVSGIIRWASLEGVALAAKNGVPPEVAVQIMCAGGARNNWMENVMGPQVLHGDLSNGFSVGLAQKDLALACQLGAEAAVPLLVGNVVREIYQMAVNEMGYDTKVDSTALMMDRLAGTQVVSSPHRFS